MPTDIYIGDTPIREVYLGDDPTQLDNNNGCKVCGGYSIRKDSGYPFPCVYVTARNCFNNQEFTLEVCSTVTRNFFASEIISVSAGSVFASIGTLSEAQGQNACKQVYGKEQYLPTDSVTFNNPSLGSFAMVGWVGKTGIWEQNLIAPGGSIAGACTISGSYISLAQTTGSLGPC